MATRTRITATYLSVGSFFDEKIKEAVLRSPTTEEVLLHRPANEGWFGASVDLRDERLFTSEEGHEAWLPISGSHKHLYTLYIGKTYNESDIEEINDDGKYDTLLSNMRGNDWDTVVHTNLGNWKPVEDGDCVISQGAYERLMVKALDPERPDA